MKRKGKTKGEATMKYNKSINHNDYYYLHNKDTGEMFKCAELQPLYEALRYNYRSCYWTAEHEVETNSLKLIACYNNLMAHC